MTEMELFRFKHGDDEIVVFSPGGTAPVFYRKNGGEPQDTYAIYKESRGKFVDDKGNELGYRDAISYVRDLL